MYIGKISKKIMIVLLVLGALSNEKGAKMKRKWEEVKE